MSAHAGLLAARTTLWATLSLASLASALACHPPPPTTAAATPSDTPASRPHADADASEPAPAPETGTPAVRAPPLHAGLAPAPADADPCERSCAAVHGCLLALARTSPSAAASVELGCLGACVIRESAQEPDPFPCAAPVEDRGEGELLVSCEEYLACVERTWTEPPPPAPTPPDAYSGRGCQRACQAFASCRGLVLDDENDRRATDQCLEKCTQVLDPSQEKRAGECTALHDCDAIEACIQAIPGA